jgi:hypothetical protein
MTTTPSVETASTVVKVGAWDDRATSMLAKHLRTSGRSSPLEDTKTFLTYGSLHSGRSGLVPTAIRQLYPWSLCSIGVALQQAQTDVLATLGTHTNGDTVTLVFATPVWRLLIATTNTILPAAWGTELSEFAVPVIWRFLTAKLFAQPRRSEDSSSSVLRVWHAVVPAADDEATLQFLSMAVGLSQTHSTAGFKPSQ